ncbi:MAG TPA: SRPBCC family protein [Nocardioidaceae bacterium]|nr:SRPBCC family protein [Nocardioidaceae bacterium]
MLTLQRRVTVDRPIEQVFPYLADFSTTEEWEPGTVSCRRVSGDGGVGTTYQNVSKFLGRETELTYVVEEFEDGRRIMLRGENETVVSRDTMVLRPDGAGTEIHYTAEFEFSGLAKYAEPLLRLPLKKLGDDAVKGMRRALERV